MFKFTALFLRKVACQTYHILWTAQMHKSRPNLMGSKASCGEVRHYCAIQGTYELLVTCKATPLSISRTLGHCRKKPIQQPISHWN